MAKPAPSTCLFHLIASPFIQLLQELSSISYFHQVYLLSPKYSTNLTTSHGLCHLCLGPGLHLLSSPQIHPQDPSFHMYPSPFFLPFRLMTLQGRAIFFFKKICFFQFWLCWVLLAAGGLFSNCSKQGLFSSCTARASHCSGFSCCRAWALGARASLLVAPRL